jgi:subtilisin family serine protease
MTAPAFFSGDAMNHASTTFACALAATLLLAPAASAQSGGKVDESAIRIAAQNSRARVIILMEAPASGGQQAAFANPIGFLQSTLGTQAANVQAVGAGSSAVVAEVTATGLRQLATDPRVKRVFQDKLMKPYLSDTTKLMGAAPAWTAGQEGNGRIVAVLDTGVAADHPFLRGRVVREACFSSTVASVRSRTACPNNEGEMIGAGAARPCPLAEGCDHGTHVAGIAAGFDGHATAASPRLDGVARRSNIVAVQVFSVFNSNESCSDAPPCPLSFTSDQLRGLLHIKKLVEVDRMPIDSVNMSIGGGRFQDYCDDQSALTPVLGELAALDVAVVVAAGNESFTDALGEPACIRSVISVGALTKGRAVADFSNSAPMLTLLAPGVEVVSSIPTGFGSKNGTSMAAPHIAGAIAVIRAAYPDASLASIIETLRATGTPVTDPRNNQTNTLVLVDRALAAFETKPVAGVGPGAPPPKAPSAAPPVAPPAPPADGGRIFFRD